MRRITLLKSNLLLFTFLSAAAALAGADRAIIEAERAPIYAKARVSDDGIVKILRRGDAVEVGMSFSSSDGSWCEVSDPSDHRELGYMRCADIRRLQQSKSPEYVRVPAPETRPQIPAPTPRPTGSETPTLASRAGSDYVRPLLYWPALFNFTPEQQTAVGELANKGGVTACRQQIEAYTRTYLRELTAPPPTRSDPVYERKLEAMKKDFNRFAYPCMMKMLNVLDRLPDLMTPEQRAKTQLLANFKKEVSGMRRALTSPDMYRGIY